MRASREGEDTQRSAKILFVTTNEHKLREAKYLLSKKGIYLEWKREEKGELQSSSTVEVAERAAEILYRKIRKPLIVEDTALYVKSLNGFPGCYSSYVFKTIGIEGLLRLMEGKKRNSKFVSSVCYIDEKVKCCFTGVLEGRIATKKMGSKGFGFDPVFVPEGKKLTLAQMSMEEKCSISHRAKALELFADWYKKKKNFSH